MQLTKANTKYFRLPSENHSKDKTEIVLFRKLLWDKNEKEQVYNNIFNYVRTEQI